MGCISFFKGLIARLIFCVHCIMVIWRVTDVYDEPIYYCMLAPIPLLLIELIVTIKCTETGEWKWFCPSVFLYLTAVVPGLWLLQFNLYNQREDARIANGWEECENEIFNATGLSEVQGVSIPLALSDDRWVLGLEQIMLCLLIIGRWLLPKGSLTRDQLSQLLLVYIGMAADILEFSIEGLKEPVVICNLLLIVITLVIWSVALLQFSLVLTSVAAPKVRNFANKTHSKPFCGGCCCANEIWSLWITLLMQDGPFLAMRLYLMLNFNIVNQMMLFFTCKNVMVIALQLYRMCIVCCQNKVEPISDDQSDGKDVEQGGMVVVESPKRSVEKITHQE